MPGIAGFCAPQHESHAGEPTLARMLQRIAPEALTIERSMTMRDQAALGWIGRGGQLASAHVASADQSAIVFDGEIYGVGSQLSGSSTNEAAQCYDRGAATVLHGYLSEGASFLARIEGRFAAAIWDASRQTCVLLNDKFGTKPLYYCCKDGRFAFATAIRSLLTLPWASTDLNPRGLVQFFAFGHLWNSDTFYSEIQCLEPGMLVRFDARDCSLRTECYWRPRAMPRRTVGESLVDLDAQFKGAVDDRTLHAERLGVALSGGLDARTILGLMDRRRASATCVSLGIEGSMDQRSARRLAELAGSEFHTLVLGAEFLGDFEQHLHDMVELTDGHYLSQCIVMPTLPLYERLGIRVLLRGHAGELVHMHKAYNFSVDASVNRIGDLDTLLQWLLPRIQSHLTDGVNEQLLCGVSQSDFADLARQSLAAALDQTSHWDHPLDRISQLFLDQRTRRETAMSLAKFDSAVDVRLPYLDGRFIEAVFAALPSLRIGETVQTYMLRTRSPEFLRPANSNTGAPMGANALRRKVSYLRMKVLAKLGVRGYQPYERLGLWLRRELKPVVEKLLLSPSCLDRGLLRPDAVRNVTKRHFSGEQNHTFLLLAMMIVELGLRRTSEAEAEAPMKAGGQRRSQSAETGGAANGSVTIGVKELENVSE